MYYCSWIPKFRVHITKRVFFCQCLNLNANDYLIICNFPSEPIYNTNQSPNVQNKHINHVYLRSLLGFLGGAVVKNPPANAGDTGSSPGPGRYYMPRSNKARAPQLLSPRATTTEARAPRVRVPQQEKPPQ